MCGRFVRTSPADVLVRAFAVTSVASLDERPRWNVCPGEDVAAVVRTPDGRRLGRLRWGLRSDPARAPLVNVRSETVARRTAFRESFERRRCLLPADAFYEWRRAGGRPEPWAIRPRSGEPFGLAAIWQPAERPGELARTAVLTRAAGPVVAPIHDRMPIVVPAAAAGAWLDAADPLAAALEAADAVELEAFRVSPLVSSPRNDSPECLRPAEAEPPGGARPAANPSKEPT